MSFKQAVKNVMKGGKYDKKAAAAIVANASSTVTIINRFFIWKYYYEYMF